MAALISLVVVSAAAAWTPTRQGVLDRRAHVQDMREDKCLDRYSTSWIPRQISDYWLGRKWAEWGKRKLATRAKDSRCVPQTVSGAIEYYFGPYATEAHLVASCESGHSIYAVNGQYVGVFQMGTWERSTYGWYVVGDPPAVQVRSAHNYFVASGSDWSPWACQP